MSKTILKERPTQAVGEFEKQVSYNGLLPILAKQAGCELWSMTFKHEVCQKIL